MIVQKLLHDDVIVRAVDNPRQTLQVPRHKFRIDQVTSPECYREQVTLQLAYAATVHKVQGQTLSKILLWADGWFFTGLGYTAISRVTKLDDLFFLQFDPAFFTLHPVLRTVITWCDEVDVLSGFNSSNKKPRLPYVPAMGQKFKFKRTAGQAGLLLDKEEQEEQAALDAQLILPDAESSVPWELDEVHKELLNLIHQIPVNIPLDDYRQRLHKVRTIFYELLLSLM